MTPSVSVVITMCDSRPWIEETLRTVLAQSYPSDRLEIVLVDDASQDDGLAAANALLERHGRQAKVVTLERRRGVGTARNRGWRAATGEWIQFLEADDVLHPDKLAIQLRSVAGQGTEVAVVCSSWQRLQLFEGNWRPGGAVTHPELRDPLILRLVSLHAGFLGPAIVRRRFLDAVGGFSEDVKFAEDEHVMLKMRAIGGQFVEAPSDEPLILIREVPDIAGRGNRIDVARQRMQNLVMAERMLREERGGMLTRGDAKEISGLSDWALSELYAHDRAAFGQYLNWLREIDPSFAPLHNLKLRFASRLLGYENAEWVALVYRRLKARAAEVSSSRRTRPAGPPSV